MQISHILDRSEEEVAQLQARCREFWHHPEPTQYARNEGYLSQELQWMHIEETQPASAATGGTDDTALIERVESNSCGAVVSGGSKQVERTKFPEKKEAEQLEFEAWSDFNNIRIWRTNFSEWSILMCKSSPIQAMVWINDIESAMSSADLKTS